MRKKKSEETLGRGKQHQTNRSKLRSKQKKANDDLAKREASLAKKTNREFKRTRKRVSDRISSYYSKYGVDGKIPYQKMMEKMTNEELSDLINQRNNWRAKYPSQAARVPSTTVPNKLDGLAEEIKMDLLELAPSEENRVREHLEKLAERAVGDWRQTLDIFSDEWRTNQITSITENRWTAGTNFSEKIWNNQERLANTLNRELKEALIRGDDFSKVEKMLVKRFNVGAKQAHRLVFTEGSYVQNEAKARVMESLTEKYMIETMNDSKVCETCRHLNGEVFNFSEREPGENFPPFHPSCRCSITFPDDEIEEL